MVLLYDHNVQLYFLCGSIHQILNIRNSLVNVSLLLSSFSSNIKILSVYMDLLLPVLLYDQQGHTLPQFSLFNQGDVAFFRSQHLLFACLASFFFLTFTLLPILLFFCSYFQVCHNHTCCSCQLLQTFMDTFQDTTRMAPMALVTSDSSPDYTSSSVL